MPTCQQPQQPTSSSSSSSAAAAAAANSRRQDRSGPSGRKPMHWGGNRNNKRVAPNVPTPNTQQRQQQQHQSQSPKSNTLASYVSPSPPPSTYFKHPQYHNGHLASWTIPSTSAEEFIERSATTPTNSNPYTASNFEQQPWPANVSPDGNDEEEEDTTPYRSNVYSSSTRWGPTSPTIKRSLHNSHRKQKLHHIIPRVTPTDYNQLQSSAAVQAQHRGNGVVLDLTSLFSDSQCPTPVSPAETSTTAATSSHNNQFNLHNNNKNNKGTTPGVPPWKAKARARQPTPRTDTTALVAAPRKRGDNLDEDHPSMQWDTKSQTTQEAVQTERQCQALTQWLNFALVGEQHQQHGDGSSPSSSPRNKNKLRSKSPANQSTAASTTTGRPLGRSFDSDDADLDDLDTFDEDEDDETLGYMSLYSRSTTGVRPTTPQNRPQTPMSMASTIRSTTPVGPSPVPTLQAPHSSSTSIIATTTKQPRRPIQLSRAHQQRRLSLFQYAHSYEHIYQQAHHWFHVSEHWKELRTRIRSEISSGKLALRDDRNIYANVACRETLLKILLTYRPSWLCLALEVVMNRRVPITSATGYPNPSQFKKFIVERVLQDKKLLRKYTQGRGSRTPSGQFEEAYLAEWRPLVLYRLMVLVFFLDRAAERYQLPPGKQGGLGHLFHGSNQHHYPSNNNSSKDNNPSKSNNNSTSNENPLGIKSTAQVLVVICREFMSRQGDIIKQLARVNLHVRHIQGPLDEIELPIQNFAIDLRDGVRLCRLVEILFLLPRQQQEGGVSWQNNNSFSSGVSDAKTKTNGIDASSKYPLLSQLRIPAISRLQKIHNVNVALQALQGQCQIGFPRDIQAHHIVDGQRRMVMQLMWSIVLIHCFENSIKSVGLSQEQLKEEIASLGSMIQHAKRMHLKKRQQGQKQHRHSDPLLHLLEQETDDYESVGCDDDTTLLASARSKDTLPSNQGQPLISPRVVTPSIMSRASSFDGEDNMSCSSKSLLEDTPVLQQWKELLWQWCQQVCVLVEKEVHGSNSRATLPGNWTSVDLKNGKALCCLIHHYHPTLLKLEELRLKDGCENHKPPTRIEATTPTTVRSQQRFFHSRQQRLAASSRISVDYHLRLAQRRLSDLGEIPPMLLLPNSISKKSHNKQPAVAALVEEKSIMVFLYHVGARMLESRRQVQAVLFVQQRYRFLQLLVLRKLQRQAAGVIWQCWRKNKETYYKRRLEKYGRSVHVIETFTIQYFDRLLQLQQLRLERDLQNAAVRPIQAMVRRFLVSQQYFSLLERHYAAIAIQTRYRQFQAVLTYNMLKLEVANASRVLQRHMRGYIQRREYVSLIYATIKLQSFIRGAILIRRIEMRSWHTAAAQIQRVWRGFFTQLHFQLLLLDIVTIQCLARRRLSFQVVSKRKDAVAVLQRAARCFLYRLFIGRKITERKAAGKIQSSYRLHLVERDSKRLRRRLAETRAIQVLQRFCRAAILSRRRQKAAAKIQTYFRMWSAFRAYRCSRAASIIQRNLRGWVLSRRYCTLRSAAIKVQTIWRSNFQRRGFIRWLQCLILVQSVCRRRLHGKGRLEQRKAALQMLQKCSRQWLAIRNVEALRKYRHQLLEKTVLCQSIRRRTVCHSQFHAQKLAVLKIQCRWRSYRLFRCIRRKLELLEAMSACHRVFRRSQKGAFKIIPHTRIAVTLSKQTVVRCGSKRIPIVNPSTWVQSYRGHRQNVFWHRKHLQTVRRKYDSGVLLEDLQRRRLDSIRKFIGPSQAAIVLQTPWLYPHSVSGRKNLSITKSNKEKILKGSKSRRYLNLRRHAKSICYSLVEASTRKENKKHKIPYEGAVKRLRAMELALESRRQSLRRSIRFSRTLNVSRRNTSLISRKTTKVERFVMDQSSTNPWALRRMRKRAASVIQACWRRHEAVGNYKKDIRNIALTQTIGRRFIGKQRKLYRVNAILTVQRVFRGVKARRISTKLTDRILTLQRYLRGFHARLRLRKAKQGIAAVIIQARVRGWQVREQLRQLNKHSIKIQSLIRKQQAAWSFRLDLERIARLQNLARKRRALKFALSLREAKRRVELERAALNVQTSWRCLSTKKTYQDTMRRIIYSQGCVRRWRAQRRRLMLHQERERRKYAKEHCAAELIQKTWRKYLARNDYLLTLHCVIMIQSQWRCLMQQCAYESVLYATIALQAAARGIALRSQLGQQHRCATVIQARFRVGPAMADFRRHRLASIIIQRNCRGFLFRQEVSLMHFASTEIQKTWRGFIDSANYIFLIVSVIKIQSVMRMAIAKKRWPELYRIYMIRQACATRVQTLCRVFLAKTLRLKMRQERDAATRIQSIARLRLARKPVAEQKKRLERVIAVQAFLRMMLACRQRQRVFLDRQRKLHAAIKVQSFARMAIINIEQRKIRERELQQKAAIKIQSFMRMAYVMILAEINLINMPTTARRRSEVNGNRRRYYRTIRGLQRRDAPRKKQTESREVALHRRVSLSQGMIRGYLTRKHSNIDVRRSNSLIREAELRSKLDPSMRLGNRMLRGLELLKTSTSLTEMMNTVCTLELATRFSKECCEEFVLAGATPIVLGLLRDCNKSLPHVEFLYYSMCTLANVCRYTSLVRHVATREAADTFLYLIRMYGSEDAIFCCAVSLLEVCALRNRDIKASIGEPVCRKRLEGILKQWERKVKQKAIRKSPCKKTSAPLFVVTEDRKCKAKTDMLILGISYDLNQGVQSLQRVLAH